ncbi:MAG: hypothetical protein ACK5MT_04720 [Actinomycetales bacterium]
MSALLEVPRLGDLDGLPVDIDVSGSLGVVSVTGWSGDGDTVVLTWDEFAGSVTVRWLEDSEERLVIEREAASKVSVREEEGQVEFWIWSGSDGLGGQLVVRVGERVRVTDAILCQ